MRLLTHLLPCTIKIPSKLELEPGVTINELSFVEKRNKKILRKIIVHKLGSNKTSFYNIQRVKL